MSSTEMQHTDRDALVRSRFRQVLGHYPTGVAVVTACVAGEHIGMVVGSFTSVSLDPPLVAFLADRGSQTYAKLKSAETFTVNILSAEQEPLCRNFSSRKVLDKWDGVDWAVGENAVRRLTGAVAYIECDRHSIQEAGDHDFILGSVRDLATDTSDLPLLFFQGAFGRFVPQSFIVPSHVDAAAPLALCNIAQPMMEPLARELSLDCVMQARVGDELVYLAQVSGGAMERGIPRAGNRIPHLAPMGGLHMAWEPPEVVADWIASSNAAPEIDLPGKIETMLGRLRDRGYSVVLEAKEYSRLEQVRERFTLGRATPEEVKFLRSLPQLLLDFYEPESFPERNPEDVRIISVPVFDRNADVALVLQAWNAPLSENLSVQDVAQALMKIANAVGAR